jgi:cation transport protein ChaC
MLDGQDLWVFGYGSLMWRPGFDRVEQVPARVNGWHRSLCVYSWVHRGTREHPGLVLGLDRGGACRGLAFRVEAAKAAAVLAYLREREQVTAVYREMVRPAALADGSGRIVPALFYVVDRTHPQYAGKLALPDLVRHVRQGRGISGANPDYVLNTADHMAGLGIRDGLIEALAAHLRERPGHSPAADVDDVE